MEERTYQYCRRSGIELQTETIAAEIWSFIRQSLIREHPELGRVLRGIKFQKMEKGKAFGLNGFTVCYEPLSVITMYNKDAEFLRHALLHMTYHGILMHPSLKAEGDCRIWNLACDIQVCRYQRKSEYSREEVTLHGIYKEIQERLRLSQNPEEIFKELESAYQVDDHTFWQRDLATYKDCKDSPAYRRMKLYETRKVVAYWKGKGHEFSIEESENSRKRGTRAGQDSRSVTVKKRKSYDYKTFLRQFAVYNEEIALDLDSFDYIPYWYSRTYYKDVVLMEPLEYQEARRLEEFVIAIDTSGSCSGQLVRGFLEQTYAILMEKTQFFSRMSVYVIQCDSMIQEVVHITSREAWEDYAGSLKIKGLGGTDFRPVFQLVDEKCRTGEIKNLKGMLYFTDGDGIYPGNKPDYETAFVFLNDSLKKAEVPRWALALDLHLKIKK